MTLTARLERACLRHLPAEAAPGTVLAAGWVFSAVGALGAAGGLVQNEPLIAYPALAILFLGIALHSHARYVVATRLLHDALADPDEVRDRRAEVLRAARPGNRAPRRTARAAASKTRTA